MKTASIPSTFLTSSLAAALLLALAACSDATDSGAPATRSAQGEPSAAAKMTDAAESVEDAVSDTWITTKVKSMLLADRAASGLDIGVETRDGVVMLFGTVQDQATIDNARVIAADVEGVRRVDSSSLTLSPAR